LSDRSEGINRYHVGQRISHPTYGAGTVLEITGNAVRVEFDEHGVRYLIPEPSEAEDADPLASIKDFSARFMQDVLGGKNAAEEIFDAFFGQPIFGDAPEITSTAKGSPPNPKVGDARRVTRPGTRRRRPRFSWLRSRRFLRHTRRNCR
jgi:hypothetical protein